MASISENANGTFKVRVYCGEDNKGRPIVRTKTYTPTHPNLSYAKLTKEVEEFATRFEREVKEMSGNSLDNITLEQFCEKYIQIKSASLSPATIIFYQKVIDELLLPLFGTIHLRDIRTFHVQQFITYLATKKVHSETGEKIAASTVKRYTTVFRSILTLAYRLEYIDADIGISRKLEFPKEEQTEVQAFNLSEIEALLDALKDEPIKLQALIETALYTGCRRGEIVGLKWEDVDFTNRKISIKRSVFKASGKDPVEKTPKTKSSYRIISIPQTLCDTLTKYKLWQDRHIAFMDSEWKDYGYLFTKEDGEVMHPHTPTKQFDHFLKRHNLRHLKFHGLRHTSATMLLSQGCDVKTVSTRLGHSDISTTNIYVHMLEEMDRDAADCFDHFVNHKKSGSVNK